MRFEVDHMVDYLEKRHYLPDTITSYRKTANMFTLRADGNQADPEVINEYFDEMKELGMASATIKLHRASIHMLFKSHDLNWPDNDIILPNIEEGLEEHRRRPFNVKEMRQMIFTCREVLAKPSFCTLDLGPEEIATFALATVFGFRVKELSELTGENIFPRKKEIRVKTAKHGGVRIHPIPKELWWTIPLLRDIDRTDTRSRRAWQRTLKRILLISGFNLDNYLGMGYHSIRSSVVTGLYESLVEPMDIIMFMKWKVPPGVGQQMIGAKMLVRYIQPDPKELNDRIYPLHPYINMWEIEM